MADRAVTVFPARKTFARASETNVLRVAAYARVSMGKDAMLHSLAAQVSYYSDLIQRNPEWEYAGVYAEMLTPSLIQMHPTCTQIAP